MCSCLLARCRGIDIENAAFECGPLGTFSPSHMLGLVNVEASETCGSGSIRLYGNYLPLSLLN